MQFLVKVHDILRKTKQQTTATKMRCSTTTVAVDFMSKTMTKGLFVAVLILGLSAAVHGAALATTTI
jgi:hypothetical protein